jgi:hypothetical protein
LLFINGKITYRSFLYEEKGDDKMKVNNKVYNPAGNITSLAIGDNYNIEERKRINGEIKEIII